MTLPLLLQDEPSVDTGTIVYIMDARAVAQRLLDAYLQTSFNSAYWWDAIRPREYEAGYAILTAGQDVQIAAVHEALRRLCWLVCHEEWTWHARRSHRQALEGLLDALLARRLPYTRDDLWRILQAIVSGDDPSWQPWRGVLRAIERAIAAYGLPTEWRSLLERQKTMLTGHYLRGAYRPLALRLEEILGQREPGLPEAGVPWADHLVATLATMNEVARDAWRVLLAHIPLTNGTRPSRVWLRQAVPLLDAVGQQQFKRHVVAWLECVTRHPTPGSDRNAMVLKGLLWYCSLCDDNEMTHAVSNLARALFRMAPTGDRHRRRLAGACLYALATMPGAESIAHLARLYLCATSLAAQDAVCKALLLADDRAVFVPTIAAQAQG